MTRLEWTRRHALEGVNLGMVDPALWQRLCRYEMFLNEKLEHNTSQAVANVAEKLKISEDTVYKAIAFFTIKPIRVKNKKQD